MLVAVMLVLVVASTVSVDVCARTYQRVAKRCMLQFALFLLMLLLVILSTSCMLLQEKSKTYHLATIDNNNNNNNNNSL